MELLFVTGNNKKIKSAKNILEKNNIFIKQTSLDLKEIQSDTIEEVAIEKAIVAYQKLQKPLIINDSNLVIESLNGFPGVYAKYVEKTLGDKGILKLLEDVNNRKASYVDVLVYIDKYGYQVFKSEVKGSISKESFKGDFYPFDKIFIKDNMEYPIAYYGKEEIDKLYENDTYQQLLNFLTKRKVSRGITFIDDKVILLHRIRKEFDDTLEYYAIPGGGVEEFETIEEACIREVLEEVTLDVTINKYLGFEEYETGICYYYLTNYLGGTPILGGEEKERNNPDNFYKVKLIDINKIDEISMYGINKKMIKDAYKLYKSLK